MPDRQPDSPLMPLTAQDKLDALERLGLAWYWRQDAQFRYVALGSTVSRTGRPAEYWLGRARWDVTDLMPPSFWDEHKRVLEAHQPFENLEYLVPDPAGNPRFGRWHSATGEPLFDPSGRFVGYHGFGQEVTARKRAMQGLKLSEARFRDFAQALSDWMWETDAELKYTWVSDSVFKVTGQPVDRYIGKRMDFMHREAGTDPRDADRVARALERREPFSDFLFCANEPGRKLWVVKSGVPYYDSQGRFAGYRGVNRDVTAMRLATRAASEREQRYSALFDQSPLGMIEWDEGFRILQWNAAAERVLGWRRDERVGTNMMDSATPDIQALLTRIRDDLFEGRANHVRSINHNTHRDGRRLLCSWTNSVIRDADGQPVGVLATVEDLTEQEAAASRIEHLSRHDALTGLPNRDHFNAELEEAVADSQRSGWPGAVLMINLDRFRQINDTLGYAAGDRLLLAVAHRLREMMPGTGMAARLASDEFAVLLRRQEPQAVEAFAEQVRSTLSARFMVEGVDVPSSATVGVAVFPLDGRDPVELLQAADSAMTHGKAQGGNGVQFFTASLRHSLQARRQLEMDLREAVRRNELCLHFQPQVEALSGAVVGMEALVRWQHPARGLVGPSEFIPVAEQMGLIHEIGMWVLEESCRTLADWRRAGLAEVVVAVNLSAQQFRHPSLVRDVTEALQRHGLSGADLELELTESVAMQDPGETVSLLQQLRALGTGLAIDDFGTGYSSLAYLKLLPIQRLKLDRSFVKDIEHQGSDAAICSATIALAHKLNLKVVAEGVETDVQRNYLLMNGCELLQGYLFSRPVPAPEALAYALARRPQPARRLPSTF